MNRIIKLNNKEKSVEKFKEISNKVEGVVLDKQDSKEKSLTENEVKLLVDSACEIDIIKKEFDDFLSDVKKLLLEYARNNNLKSIRGNLGTAYIGKHTTTTIDPVLFFKFLKSQGKINLFEHVFKVANTEAKKYIASDDLDKISETITNEFGSVRLKK